MPTLMDKRRSQPFREFLDSPSWLKDEPKKVPLTHGQNVAKQIGWRLLQCLIGLGFVFLLLWLWPIGERISR